MKYIFSFMASLLLLAGCSGDFLDKEPTDSVSSDEVGVPGNADGCLTAPGTIFSNMFIRLPIAVTVGFNARTN